MLATLGICATRRLYYSMINRTILYHKTRWLSTCVFILVYLQRIKGLSYDVITYLIFFYVLQLIIGYFTPKNLEQDQEDYQQIQDQDQTNRRGDFFHFHQDVVQTEKPLVRSISEVQIWERVTFVFFMGILCTQFQAFQIQVFWPVLILYSVVLFCYTIHKIITTMQKYRYGLEDFSKKPFII